MKFIFNTILWGLATFMIFAHQYVGRDYFLIVGSSLLFLNILRGYEKGASLSKIFFSIFLFLVIGSASLLVYICRDKALDQLDLFVKYLYSYGIVFGSLGLIGFMVYLVKEAVSRLHYGSQRRIGEKNHEIYMNNSSSSYLSKEQEDRKISQVKGICDFIVIWFIILSTYAIFTLHLFKFNFEILDFNLNLATVVIICSCWLASLFYFFNVGIKFLLYAAVFHCVVGITFHSSLISQHVFTADGTVRLMYSLGYILLPAVIIFFARESKLIISFKDY